jgi:hypothetical protein
MGFFLKAALQKLRGDVFFAPLLVAVLFLAGSAPLSIAQTFGGAPPWGLEKPTHIHGELQAGDSLEQPIGGGLTFYILALNNGFRIEISPTNTGLDLTRCATGPFHGRKPTEINAQDFVSKENSFGGVGQKRWFDYGITPEDDERLCSYLDCLLYPSNQDPKCRRTDREFGGGSSGRGWLQITGVKLSDAASGEEPSILSMSFEAECTLYGGLQLWILPATYVIPNDFAGWVAVYHGEKGASKLPRADKRYTVQVNKSATVHTSSNLRSDLRGAQFITMNRKPIPIAGPARGIRCYQNWSIGDSSGNHFIQSFFVGTPDELNQTPHNPLLPSGGDCSD